MKTNVFILATCLNHKMMDNTLMVFKTIRIGFPTADIKVCGNRLDQIAGKLVEEASLKVGAQFDNFPEVAHGAWIESLLYNEREPFWICDTDITFHKPVEHWFENSDKLFAGRYEPEFYEPWTQSQSVARLHPSLMWFNPRMLRAAIRAWPSGDNQIMPTVEKNLIRWSLVPVRGSFFLYDTCAGLHHALGGELFNREQNDCFTHRFCGTYSHITGVTEDWLKEHEAICKASMPEKELYAN
jgi:hypothetical protein